MSVSALFLKKLGISAARLEARNLPNKVVDYEGSSQGCTTCCGVRELTDLEGLSAKWVFQTVAACIFDNQDINCFVYYGVNSVSRRALVALGFKDVAQFVNPGTGNTVHVLVLTL